MADPPRVMLGATLLIALQFASRALTFVANQLLLRYLTAQLLGVATQLEVFYLSVLFFARESLRVAIQRQQGGDVSAVEENKDGGGGLQGKGSGDGGGGGGGGGGGVRGAAGAARRAETNNTNTTQAAVNLAFLAPTLGVLLAGALGALYTLSLSEATLASTPHLVPAVYLYALAALLELLSEPAYVLLQLRLQLAARARAEGLATLAKCGVTLGVAVYGRGEMGVLPFALGQVAFGGVLLGVYLVAAAAQGFSLLPRRIVDPTSSSATGRDKAEEEERKQYVLGWFYAPTLRLATTIAAQNIVKYFLTQGDSLLMGVLASAETQGVYALAANYGSLAARLVFQPVEEASRNYFSRLLAGAASDEVRPGADKVVQKKKGDGGSDASSSSGAAAVSHHKVDITTDRHDSSSAPALAEAHSSLTRLLHIYNLITLPLLALGPHTAPLLLSLITTSHWTRAGAGTALAAYVYYIPLLALNGLLEAFVASVATHRDLVRQSVWMGAFFAVFGGAAVLLVREWGWGARGVVVANAANMALRIAWAARFTGRWFAARGGRWSVQEVLPGPAAVAAAAVAGQVVARMGGGVVGGGVKEVAWEVAKVGGVAVVLLPVLAFTERHFLIECYRAVKAG